MSKYLTVVLEVKVLLKELGRFKKAVTGALTGYR